MKNKVIQNGVLALFLVFLFLGFAFKVSAQVEENLLLISTYSNDSEMDAIFENSKRVLVYTEGGDNIDAKVLSIATVLQKDTLVEKGIKTEVVIENPDIARYVLLYNPKEGQSKILEDYGKPIIISPYYTLLELEKGKELVFEGPIAKFFAIPFLDEVVRPPKGTPVQPRISEAPFEQKSDNEGNTNKKIVFVVSLFFVIVIILGAVLFIWKKKKSQNMQNF